MASSQVTTHLQSLGGVHGQQACVGLGAHDQGSVQGITRELRVVRVHRFPSYLQGMARWVM